jgi:hypothetical protein
VRLGSPAGRIERREGWGGGEDREIGEAREAARLGRRRGSGGGEGREDGEARVSCKHSHWSLLCRHVGIVYANSCQPQR